MGDEYNHDPDSSTAYKSYDSSGAIRSDFINVDAFKHDFVHDHLNEIVNDGRGRGRRLRINMKRHSFEELDERNPEEILLFRAIAAKNTKVIKELASKHGDKIKLHHRDFEGHDLLTRAVQTDDMNILQQVLSINPATANMRCALLAAAKEGKLKMIFLLLYFQDEERAGSFYAASARLASENNQTNTRIGRVSSSLIHKEKYSYDITPLMMAAMHGHYEIIQLFHNRGHILPSFHLPSCACRTCKSETRDLERTEKRIHLLEAMANPAYLSFMAERGEDFDSVYKSFIAEPDEDLDPVFKSFILAKSVKRCIVEEDGFSERYEKILEKLEQLPFDLIDLCRNTDETTIFLSQKMGYDHGSLDEHPYPRLAFAIDKTNRKFVANPNIQFLIENEFIGYTINPRSGPAKFMKNFFTFMLVALFPLMNVLMWLSLFCCCKFGFVKYLLSPRNRCWSKLGSYLYFCVLLIYLNMWERSEGPIDEHIIWLRWAVILFVFSHFVQLIRQLLINSHHFFQRGWNWYDMTTQIFFWITFGIWLYDYETHFSHIPTSHRELDCWNPLLIGECVFAVASTMATLRLIRWFILSPDIGALQTAMGRMVYDISTILIFFCWTALTFGISSKILYNPYLRLEKDGKKQSNPLTDPVEHFFTFFKFGKIGPSDTALYTLENKVHYETGEDVEHVNPQQTTQFFISVICVVYNIVVVSFLRNTVTGLFGSTQKAVIKAKAVEWKYNRVQEWLYYIQDTTLAPPFNILPHGGCIYKLARCSKFDVESSSHAKEQYSHLMRKLFQRYFQKELVDKMEKDKNKDKKKDKKK